jgi:uncharacterized protein (UPF0332 family)
LKARTIMRAGVPDVAAREAYMTSFHAAQALIFERRGKVPRTHSGVHGIFGQLAKGEPGLDRALGRFLPNAYELKDIADYSTDRTVEPDEAEAAIRDAAEFLGAVEAVLGAAPTAQG